MLGGLARGETQIVIWHGQSAGDQLMLRRVAFHLRNAPQRLNEAKLSAQDLLIATNDTAPISVLRISRLALEWRKPSTRARKTVACATTCSCPVRGSMSMKLC